MAVSESIMTVKDSGILLQFILRGSSDYAKSTMRGIFEGLMTAASLQDSKFSLARNAPKSFDTACSLLRIYDVNEETLVSAFVC